MQMPWCMTFGLTRKYCIVPQNMQPPFHQFAFGLTQKSTKNQLASPLQRQLCPRMVKYLLTNSIPNTSPTLLFHTFKKFHQIFETCNLLSQEIVRQFEQWTLIPPSTLPFWWFACVIKLEKCCAIEEEHGVPLVFRHYFQNLTHSLQKILTSSMHLTPIPRDLLTNFTFHFRVNLHNITQFGVK